MTESVRHEAGPAVEAAESTDVSDREKQDLYTASQRQLIWRRFRRHRLAQAALIMLALLYVIAATGRVPCPLRNQP